MSIQSTESVLGGLLAPPTTDVTGSSTESDKEMFLQLLTAQMRYQDPLNPMDSGEFLAQSAQFTALEKMQDVADQTAQLLAANVAFGASALVGRTVTWSDPDGGELSGTVDSVSFGPEGPQLVVGGTELPLTIVQSVAAQGAATGTVTPEPAAAAAGVPADTAGTGAADTTTTGTTGTTSPVTAY